MKGKLKIATPLIILFVALSFTMSASAEDLEVYTHKLTQSDSSYDFWTTPPSERVFKDDELPSETASEVRVYAAKNEFEPFQIVVRPSASGSVSVNIGDFGSGISSEIYQVKYVNIAQATDNLGKTGDYPDPLWPVEKGVSVNVTANENTAFWFSLSVPKTAASGDYTANAEIGGVSIPVRLHVFNFAIPDEVHVKSQMNFSHQRILDYYSVADDDYWMYVDKMKQFFIDHRLTSKSPLWSGSITSEGGEPYIDYDCDNKVLADTNGIWGFEKLAERYLGGSGLLDGKFTEAFNEGTGFPSFMAATFQNNDASDDQRPSAFCGITRGTGDWYTANNPSSAYNTKWFDYMKVLQDYLNSLGYLDKSYYYMANEPQDQDDYDAVAWYSQELKKAAPNLKLMVSEEPKSEIYNHLTYTDAKIDIWLPVLNNYDPEISHDREKNHGEETWIYFLHGTRPPYFNPITLDHPGAESKFTGWFLWKYRVRGIAYYSLNNWDKNPWTDPMTDGHNGDTFMLYPPSETNDHIAYGSNNDRFVPSIRFELMRDSLEDYEYLYMLNGGSQPVVDQSNTADTQADKIISGLTSYTRDGEFMYNLRRVIGLRNGNEIDTIPDIQPEGSGNQGTPGNYYINFQDPSGSPTADPLIADGKEYVKIGWNEYDESLGYGWYGDMAHVMYEYYGEASELQKSIIYDDWGRQKTFEFDLPNGTYNVTVSVGWYNKTYPHHKIEIENISFVNDEGTTPSSPYIVRTKEVTVEDGKLTMAMGIFDEYTMLNYMNIEAVGGVTLPECTESNWNSSDGECQSDNTLTRTWTKTGDCDGGVSHPATESVTCEYQLPECTDSDWQSSDGECQSDNTLTRTWTQTGDCDNGVSHPATERIACDYQEPADDVPCDCSPLPDPGTDETVVKVSTVDALQNEINSASGPTTIYLESGTYNVTSDSFINVGNSDITIRSESGNRDDVIIQGEGMGASETGHGIYIDASRITIADLTIQKVPNHAIIVQPDNSPSDLLFHNIRCVDTGQQIVKVSGGVDSNPKNRGIIQCSVFEYTTTLDEGAYTNGIDILNAHDWIIRDNVIRNIKAAPGAEELAGPAILAWHESSNTIVERNQIIDCDFGISFGNSGQSGISHTGGIIRNNFIKGHSESDFGIGIIFAPDAKVLNNTIYSPGSWGYSIEARFTETTNCLIMNNLTDEPIWRDRNGASSTLTTNVENASESDFADVESGDLHLSDSSTIAVDQGTVSEDVSTDIDCQPIPVGALPDIGADEKCVPVSGIGDLSSDCTISLSDAILALQVVIGKGSDVSKDEDMNADDRVGLYEAIRILSDVSSAR